MHYMVIENGAYAWPVTMTDRYNGIGAWHTLTDAQRATHQWYPINYLNNEYDAVNQARTLISARLIDNIFVVEYAVRNLTADEHKARKVMEIRQDLVLALREPVEALGILWNSGMNSSVAIDGAARIAESAGLTDVTIHSIDNKSHVLSTINAVQVAVAIGGDYQQKFATKQSRMVALDEVDLTASDAIAQITAI